jgi:hypothetical protein
MIEIILSPTDTIYIYIYIYIYSKVFLIDKTEIELTCIVQDINQSYLAGAIMLAKSSAMLMWFMQITVRQTHLSSI